MTITPERLIALINDMQQHGTSLTLNWGEDNNLWECSWIMGGARHTGFSTDIGEAALRAYYKGRGRTWLDLGPETTPVAV